MRALAPGPARPLVQLAVVFLLVVAPLLLGDFRLFLLTEILIFGLFAASLDLLVGYTGLLSLGHAAYLGVGSYATALIAIHLTDNVFAGLAAGVASSCIVAAATGWLAVRTRGVYFLMLTLAFAQLLFTLAITWDSLTHGANGLPTPKPTLGPGDSGGALDGGTAFYYYALVAFLFGLGLLRAVVASPFGRALVGIRENESRMRSLGYATSRYKLAAFCLAGAVAGFAGSLTVQQSSFMSPSGVSFEVSALALIAVIIGGRATLVGAVLGSAFVFVIRDELSSAFNEHWRLVLGLVFIGVVYLLPRGISGLSARVGGLLTRRTERAAGEPA
ncbi:MAG: branched-chain amino acid ABC transporter permease [Gaiellaceae bacterium MAG52_C11]|nr:branched-chain amino acid ABC transporter permease [Candidatus Gaiellasilicea maunaloa]